MNQMENALADFHPTTLDDMNGIKLLKRYDTKFTFHKDQLADVFDHLTQKYKILEIGQNRSFAYETLYYDTDDYLFYHQHHNQKLNRYKVRCRRYRQSNQRFFEVKFKNNRKKTIKSRLPLANGDIHPDISEESKIFAKERMTNGHRRIVDQLSPKLKVEYNRITLTNQAKKERLTIDTDLTYIDNNSKRCRIDNLIIIELKSERASMNSELYQYLKGLNILPAKFSKYCMGVAITEQKVKRNRFKKKLLRLNRLS
ncbi:MAG: polyphosphate polymerase domain-containing protein [Desulfobacteraceae bacterium]